MQVASVPAGKSSPNASACAPGIEGSRPGSGRWFEYLMKIRPWMMEAQVRRRREGPWRMKRWRQCLDRGVPRRRLVHRLFVALEWMDSQACVRGRLMWNLGSFSVRRVSHGSWGWILGALYGGHGSEQWGGNLLRQRGDNMHNVKVVSGG